ncbi:hypothetical protein ACKFKF_30275 [Phormidesmis sp. 146-12]
MRESVLLAEGRRVDDSGRVVTARARVIIAGDRRLRFKFRAA